MGMKREVERVGGRRGKEDGRGGEGKRMGGEWVGGEGKRVGGEGSGWEVMVE